jgi:undecaprenyl phosphate-alpha-L-ara4N flippase subunit ArnF
MAKPFKKYTSKIHFKNKMNHYFYILFTLLFTVYGQLILKWRLSNLKVVLPGDVMDKFFYLIRLVLDPFILSGFIAAFVASLFWMAAMTKFEITYAYPFMSLAPALVFLLGIFVLNESFTLGKVIGLIIIMLGIVITVKF